jgi:hypothetical protein
VQGIAGPPPTRIAQIEPAEHRPEQVGSIRRRQLAWASLVERARDPHPIYSNLQVGSGTVILGCLCWALVG